MRELLTDLERLRQTGPVGRAVVIDVRGSAPRLPGTVLLAAFDAAGAPKFAGSLAGGCVEGAAIDEIAASLHEGTPRLLGYQLDDATGWSMGLACGGAIRALVEPCVRPEIEQFARAERGGVVATVTGGDAPLGAAFVVDPACEDVVVLVPAGADADGAAPADLADVCGDIRTAALAALADGESRCIRVALAAGASAEVFLEVLAPPPALFIYGATEIAAALVAVARVLGWRPIVADARSAFLEAERFPGAEALVRAWPDAAFAGVHLTRRDAVCILTHDPKLDVPAAQCALASGAGFVGLLGSRRTQALRRTQLREAGVSEADIARLRGPVGLELRGRTPAETALAIAGEIVALRRGGSGRPITSLLG